MSLISFAHYEWHRGSDDGYDDDDNDDNDDGDDDDYELGGVVFRTLMCHLEKRLGHCSIVLVG